MTKANDSLKHFTGTEVWYKDLLTGFQYTEGIKELADMCEAYWLLDLVFSHQNIDKVAEESFQVWELKRQSGDIFNVVANDGNGHVIASQQIPYSDFPYDSAVVWMVHEILLLPSEY